MGTGSFPGVKSGWA